MPSEKPLLHIIMEPELLVRIDNYRYTNRIASRSAAVRLLIERALRQSDEISRKVS